MRLKLIAVFTMVFLASCIIVPKPTSEQNTLVVGKFLVNWNRTDKMKGGSGTYKANILIYFQNDQTGKISVVSTLNKGWLLTRKLSDGNYKILKYYIEQQYENTIYKMTLTGTDFIIKIEEGKVNNLGTIQIDIGNDGYSVRVVDFDVVKYDFKIEFKDSKWNSYDWKQTPIAP